MSDISMREWVKISLELCERATAAKCLILFRNDDEEVIVTNGQEAAVIRELGRGLACGYNDACEPGTEGDT